MYRLVIPDSDQSDIDWAANEVFSWIEPSANPRIDAACTVLQSEIIDSVVETNNAPMGFDFVFSDFHSGFIHPVEKRSSDPELVVIVASRDDLGLVINGVRRVSMGRGSDGSNYPRDAAKTAGHRGIRSDRT